MKKISLFLLIIITATSCAVGTYYPYARNNFGAQTTVVLDKANFRVVRDVEAIVEVNNTKLSRADVANSAYGALLKKAHLTGSQVLINVVIEEIQRASGGFFRWLIGCPEIVQHVAARATIIEFLDENGNPRMSNNNNPQGDNVNTCSQIIPQKNSDAQNIVNEVIQEKELASAEDIQNVEHRHTVLVKMVNKLRSEGIYITRVFKIYEEIYNSTNKTKESIQELITIQDIILTYGSTRTTTYSDLSKRLQNTSSLEEQKAIILSCQK